MERLTNSGTKEAKSNVTIRQVTNKLSGYEDTGVAVFGMCGGAWIKQKELCSKCPYWVGKAGGKDAGSI